MIVAIDAGYFYAGVVIEDGHVIDAAPIVRYMIGWPQERVTYYCKAKRWQCVLVDEGNTYEPSPIWDRIYKIALE